MDFKKKFIALSSVAGALLAIALLGFVFSPERRQARAARGELVPARAVDKAASFEIAADGSAIEIISENGGWAYREGGNSFPVPQDRVKAFFKALGQIDELYKVSSKKETWKDFGLEDGKRSVSMKDSKGTVLAEAFVGKADPSGKRVYAAIGGKEAVYLVSNAFTSYLRSDKPSWSDLRIFPKDLKKQDVQEIIVKADIPASEGGAAVKADYRFLRDPKKTWKLQGGADMEIDPAKVDGLVNGIIGMDAESFVYADIEAAATRLKEPGATVILRTGKGEELELSISKDQVAGKHAVKASGKDYLYEVSGYNVSYYLKDLSSFKLVKQEKEKK